MQGEHGLWWKHVFYEESARVPLIMAWAGQIEGGQRCDRVVSALDVTATMLDALGAPALPNSPGRSLLPLVNGTPSPTWEDVAFSEYCTDQFGPPEGAYQRMIRQGKWKLIYYHGQPSQLFNLAEDPGEIHDRAADPGCRAIPRRTHRAGAGGLEPRSDGGKMAAKESRCIGAQRVGEACTPPEQHLWTLRPEMNRLDPA